jgi:WXG100 family type VII secretion target
MAFDVHINNIEDLRGSGNRFCQEAVRLTEDLKKFSNQVDHLTSDWSSGSKDVYVDIQLQFRRAFQDVLTILGDFGGRVVQVANRAEATEGDATHAIRRMA